MRWGDHAPLRKHFNWKDGFEWPKQWFAWYPVRAVYCRNIDREFADVWVWLETVNWREHQYDNDGRWYIPRPKWKSYYVLEVKDT